LEQGADRTAAAEKLPQGCRLQTKWLHINMKQALSLLSLILLSLSPVQAAETFEIDPIHSSVLFKIRHLNVADFHGRFNEIKGNVSFDKDSPEKSAVTAEVAVESVDTHNDKRNQHLKSPDFFNAKQFPTISFKSTKVEKSGDIFKITGDFTLHGVTKSITVDFKKVGEGKGMQGELRAGGGTEFTIKRSDYGMTFMQNAVGDEVGIILSLEAVKK
jgi:polyisoprenoid-binding protein YceI